MLIAGIFSAVFAAWVGLMLIVRRGNFVGRPPTRMEIAARIFSRHALAVESSFRKIGVAANGAVEAMVTFRFAFVDKVSPALEAAQLAFDELDELIHGKGR